MNKKSIIIIIVCTLIFIAVSLTTVYREPAIESIYLSEEEILSSEQLAELGKSTFSGNTENIYLIIEVKYLDVEHIINITWEKYENERYTIVQQDTVYPERQGSGFITITMAKRNEAIPEGTYRVEAILNNRQRMVKNFEVR
ncbi:MAG: hypothetical protein ACQEP5_04520 [Actinomycetota bacterium]